jgi:hypothetical protein
MSRAGVGMVIEKLLTDEDLRIRFAVDRMETVAEISLRGFDLSQDELDLFCRTDAGLWFLGAPVKGERQHEAASRNARFAFA